ncbi:MAG: glycerate kinase [Deltaproteobacteria bacterium]
MSGNGNLERLRKDARQILNAALEAADPEIAVKRFVKLEGDDLLVGSDTRISLRTFGRVLVVGGGKGSAPMGKALEDVLGDRLEGGVICVKYGHGLPLKKIRVMEAAHPLPDSAGEKAAQQIMTLLESAGSGDLVISCISGGGSALLPAPAEPVTLQQKEELTKRLLEVGADIHQINTVRKHLSLVKGGNLTRIAYPAFVGNLMLSDVIGDDPDTIASGPFVPDRSTFGEALEILRRYELLERAPKAAVRRIQDGAEGKVPENPKEGDEIFDRVRNVIVGSNIISLRAGEAMARELGYRALILSSTVRGDTTQAALFHSALAEEICSTGNPVAAPACLLSGGETTVVIKGSGFGGRNQEFALALVRTASRLPNTLFLSAGTDGTDGPTDAAGAVVDSRTLERAEAAGLNPDAFLARNDSYHFFHELGDLIMTGPTRTNVMDARIVLVGE